MRPLPLLKINLFGGINVELDGVRLTKFRSTKSRALLAHLAAQPDQEHERSLLATLLWGDLPESTAKTNLRVELSGLKKLLNSHPALMIARNSVRFDSHAAEVDTVAFERALAGFESLSAEVQGKQLHKLSQATDLYIGEFLAGIHIAGAAEFDEWRRLHQEKLHQDMMRALSILQQLYAEKAMWSDLAQAAQKQTGLVPWEETAHRYWIQALAAQGMTQAAIEQYEKCKAILLKELGQDPEPATQALVEQLQQPATTTRKPIRHNLARSLKSFVGRQEQVDELKQMVKQHRLVTLLGIGGVGKSHLAQTAGIASINDFADGVWFVPLANIEPGEASADLIVLAIAGAIRLKIADLQHPTADLIEQLQGKRLLLILDNWEHLLTAADAVVYPLLEQTDTCILATSRARLNIDGEQVMPLGGLKLEDGVQLFVDRARKSVPGFVADHQTDTQVAIEAVCKLVDGLPLGIELAASWVEHVPVAEIAQSIGQVSLEPTQAAAVADRHHSLSNVFEYSWQLLSDQHRQILSKTALFRGGFDRTAAEAVTGASLNDLSLLIAHSLLRRVSAGRYDLHPLVQEFAAAKLSENLQAMADGLRIHRHHYFEQLALCAKKDFQKKLSADYGNLRRGWRTAIEQNDIPILHDHAEMLGDFIETLGMDADGNTLFQAATDHLKQVTTVPELEAKLLARQASFSRSTDGFILSNLLDERVLLISADPRLRITAHNNLANSLAEIGQWEAVNSHTDQAAVEARQTKDPVLIASVIEYRIFLNAIHFRGDYLQYIKELEELLTLVTDSPGGEPVVKRILHTLEMTSIRYGDYGNAKRVSLRRLEGSRAAGHRPDQVHHLLGLALSEQFAGLYVDAIAHNREALRIAEEINIHFHTGMLKANMCLTLRQTGDCEEALRYGYEMLAEIQSVDKGRIEGMCMNRIGHVYVKQERWDDAYKMYQSAVALWDTLDHPNRYEATAGLALAAVNLGKTAEAINLVDEALRYVDAHNLVGFVEPVLLLLNCAKVLRSINQNERAESVLKQAQGWIEMTADRISDNHCRQSFLNNRPDNLEVANMLNAS